MLFDELYGICALCALFTTLSALWWFLSSWNVLDAFGLALIPFQRLYAVVVWVAVLAHGLVGLCGFLLAWYQCKKQSAFVLVVFGFVVTMILATVASVGYNVDSISVRCHAETAFNEFFCNARGAEVCMHAPHTGAAVAMFGSKQKVCVNKWMYINSDSEALRGALHIRQHLFMTKSAPLSPTQIQLLRPHKRAQRDCSMRIKAADVDAWCGQFLLVKSGSALASSVAVQLQANSAASPSSAYNTLLDVVEKAWHWRICMDVTILLALWIPTAMVIFWGVEC